MNDHEIAGLLARETGQILLQLREKVIAQGGSNYQLQRLGDETAHNHLINRLRELKPVDAVLSEEGVDNFSRLSAVRVWIVDPLDGSQDYCRPPSVEWAVHVALVVDGFPVAAAVDLPALGTLYGTFQQKTNNLPIGNNPPVVITSRSQWGEADLVAAAIGGVVHYAGSAGVKAMAVVSGFADVYIHPSGFYEWDACAPAAVALAAGLDVSGVEGSDLIFNKSRPTFPGLLITRPEYTMMVRKALGF